MTTTLASLLGALICVVVICAIVALYEALR